jgi:hypothetical protein
VRGLVGNISPIVERLDADTDCLGEVVDWKEWIEVSHTLRQYQETSIAPPLTLHRKRTVVTRDGVRGFLKSISELRCRSNNSKLQSEMRCWRPERYAICLG